MYKIGFGLLATLLLAVNFYFIAGLFGAWDVARKIVAATLPQSPAFFETSLQSRISSTDASMTLVANSLRGGSVLSGYNCFTVDEGRTDQEFICGTISGISVTGLSRGISYADGTTTSASGTTPTTARRSARPRPIAFVARWPR
jgi:hypothetical protein